MKKIDLHVHVLPDDAPEELRCKRSSAKAMLNHSASLGIRKSVIMSGGETTSFVDSFATNRELQRITEKYPEHYAWMCNLDETGIDTIYKRLAEYKANGAGKAIMRDPEFGLHFLETYADRLFFATDMLTTDMIYPLSTWLDEQVKKGLLTQSTYNKICYENAERIFGL